SVLPISPPDTSHLLIPHPASPPPSPAPARVAPVVPATPEAPVAAGVLAESTIPTTESSVLDPSLQAPDHAVLLGDTRPTPQLGLLGEVAAQPWRRVAFDLNGCNT